MTPTENVFIAMICDQNPVLRQLGWKTIQKARQSAPNPARSESFRVFTIPNINFKANAYNEMIDWPSSTIDYADPPMVRIVSNDQVDEWAKSNAPPIYPLEDFPCHSQAVERQVKLVSEVCRKVVGEERPEGMIRSTLASRAKMPKFSSKQDYKI